MDPNANIDEQLELVKEINAVVDSAADDGTLTPEQTEALGDKAARLAELVEALDHWITGGGFLPTRWKGGR